MKGETTANRQWGVSQRKMGKRQKKQKKKALNKLPRPIFER
jgi:hypothetical protein